MTVKEEAPKVESVQEVIMSSAERIGDERLDEALVDEAKPV